MAHFTDAIREERELIHACKAGEDAALSAFYERFFSNVYRYALASVGSREDAEEIAAEVFVKAFRSIGRFRQGERPVLAWLFRIARNEVIDHYRRVARRPQGFSLDAQQNERDERSDPIETKALLMDLSGALREMPVAHREAVLLRLAAGLSSREAAQVMGIPEGTLRSHVHHGIKAIRKAME